MIRTLSLIKRRADLSRAEFRSHYETTHAPLALPHMAGLERYVRYHLEEELTGEIGFDVVSAFWFADAEATARLNETLASEAGRPILEDELTFMDKPANTFFPVSERRLVGTPADEAAEALFVFVRHPGSTPRYDSSRDFARDHVPRLLEGFGDVTFALLRDAFPVEGGTARYDAVLQVCAAGFGGLEDWSAGMRAAGNSVDAVRTRRFETDLGT